MALRTPRIRLFWRTFAWLALLTATLLSAWIGAAWVVTGIRPGVLSWAVLVVVLALAFSGGALAWTASQINQPFEDLSVAAGRLREGDLDSRLDEEAVVREIREVNAGFNRMARELSRVEQDRAVMLAGISHDLRTPLARLRLEAELSVADPQALAHMAADIDQLNAIIDKFTDYARPEVPEPEPVDLGSLLKSLSTRFDHDPRLRLSIDLPGPAVALADPTDLHRVLANLVENAARYARGSGGEPAEVLLQALTVQDGVEIRVSDRGPGVPPAQLDQLTQPFFRGNAARTEASGAGLGLAIVEKAVHRMKGHLAFRNLTPQGLEVRIVLPEAPAPGAVAA